jgi:hypothetical protein
MFSCHTISVTYLIENIKRPPPGVICALITVILLIAGLWPFDFHPGNKVRFLNNEKGIRFFGVGSVLSAKPFSFSDTIFRNNSVTMELLVRPDREFTDGAPSLLTLFDQHARERLVIAQWNSVLILKIPAQPAGPAKNMHEIGIERVFSPGQSRLVTVTSSNRGTTIYLDGYPIRNFPNFSLLRAVASASGYLVLGNVHSGRNYWRGDVLGLAIYDRDLDDRQVDFRAHAWKENGGIAGEEGLTPIGLYLFQKKNGLQIANSSGNLPDLVVPSVFAPLRRTVLQLPWKRQWRLLPDAKDVVINILGFVPFGFSLAAWLRNYRSDRELFVVSGTLAAAAAISLAIELTQVYLPMRDSSLTDVISNVLGSFIGFMVLRKIDHASRTPRSLDSSSAGCSDDMN